VATVYFPSGWTIHTDGIEQIPIEAARVDEMLRALTDRFPALAPLLEQAAIAIDGQVYHHARYEPLNADSEVHLLPPVAGGSSPW
jgi:molybdopterin converting factor small subunit